MEPLANRQPDAAERSFYPQLTREYVAAANWRSIAATIAGLALVLLACNYLAGRYLERYTTNRGYWLVAQKWTLLEEMPAPVDWLILGDSSGNQGMMPAVLTETLGGTAINLCTVASMTAANDVWMLQRYIDRFGPPSNVLIIHTYDIWQRDLGAVFLAKLPLRFGAWNDFTPAPSLTLEQQRQLLLARFVPLYAENGTLTATISRFGQGNFQLFDERFVLEPDGFMRRDSMNVRAVQRDLAAHIQLNSNRQFAFSAINEQALLEISRLANTYGFDVFLANSPYLDDLYANEGFQNYFQEMTVALSSFAAAHPRVHYLENTHQFPADQMDQVDHVIFPTAIDFSEAVVQDIQSARSLR